MNSVNLENAGRRDFFRKTALAGGGLVLGFYLNPADSAAKRVAKPSTISETAGFNPMPLFILHSAAK